MKIITLALFLSLSFPINAVEKWVNCIGNQSCYPYSYFEPRNLEELCSQVKYHAKEGRRIRAIGSGYSISDIGCTDGCLFNLKHLNKILSVNLKDKTVRVEAGVTLEEFNDKLAQNNLALSNQAAIQEISLGGALSRGVHGTGHTGSLSSFVKEYELITSDGSLLNISLESDPEAFSAINVGLGSLGIIYAVTLQCEPLFYLHKIDESININQMVKDYTQIHEANDFSQFLWNPETGKVVINRWNRCDKVSSASNLSDEGMASYKALAWYTIDKNDKDLFSEIAIPIAVLPEAIKAIQEFIKKHLASGAKFVDINIRLVDQDTHAYLSPSSDGPVACLSFCLFEEDKYLALYQEFEEMMSRYRGRPHWGKLNFLDHEKAAKLYGKNLQKFMEVKRRLDPHGTFSNKFTDRIFSKTAHIN